jgi:1,4-alpha-glucan branching enzyme
MKKWFVLLVAVLTVALLAGCAGTKKGGGTMEKAAGGAAAPKITSQGVVFSFKAPAGTKAVYLAGEFNGWRPDLDLMNDDDGDGIWTITYKLTKGTYQYKFVADGSWYQDPNNPDAAPDGFGGNNSVLVVP